MYVCMLYVCMEGWMDGWMDRCKDNTFTNFATLLCGLNAALLEKYMHETITCDLSESPFNVIL